VGASAAISSPAASSPRQPRDYTPLPDVDLDDERLDREFLALLVRLNDQAVRSTAEGAAAFVASRPNARSTAREIKRTCAAYLSPQSAHHRSPTLLANALLLTGHLEGLETASGLFDSGNNLESPPDSSFSLIDMVIVARIAESLDSEGGLAEVAARIGALAQSVAREVAQGGVHTANHRWEVAGALLEVNSLWPDRRLVRRAEEWLAEGIDVYRDGQYSERSTQYASEVVNPSLLHIAEHTRDGSLLDVVRANLRLTLKLTNPDRTVETVHSRRQDQWNVREDWWYLVQYREFAIRDGDGDFARQARRITETGRTDLGIFLGEVMAKPALALPLPPSSEGLEDLSVDLTQSSGLVRRHQGSTISTFFAGTDYPQLQTIASGLSTNPTFFTYRNGAAVLAGLRVAPTFFSMGPLRPHRIQTRGNGFVRMEAEHSTGYHQPLTSRRDLRRDGMYDLEDDGRFFSAMSFSRRRLDEVTLATEIEAEPVGQGYRLTLRTDGPATVTVAEVSFAGDGELLFDGAHRELSQPAPGGSTPRHFVTSGSVSWRVGSDVVRVAFGGIVDSAENPSLAHGEKYTYLNGYIPAPAPTQVLVVSPVPGVLTIDVSPS
jgi:hypothetical protein